MAINAELLRPTRVFHPEKSTHFWQDLTAVAVGFFSNLKLNSKNLFHPNTNKQAGETWQSLSYLNNRDQYQQLTQLLEYMALELRTYFDEYVALKVIKTYPNFGEKGIDNIAPFNLVSIAQQTKQDLAEKGFDTTRADLEIIAMQKLLNFLSDEQVPIGSCLVYISPRGPKYMYLGYELSNNNYLNLYLKTGPGQARLIQLLNYDVNESLINQFLPFLSQQQAAQIYSPFQSANPLHHLAAGSLSDEHFLINTLMLIPADQFNLDLVIQQAFQNSAQWLTKISDFPQFDYQAYVQQENQLLALFKQLTEQVFSANEDPQLNAQKLDQLVAIMKKNFQKWTEENASNYHPVKQISKLNLMDIETEWRLACKKITGQQLNQQEQQHAKQLQQRYQLNPSLPLQKISHLNFCLPRFNLARNLQIHTGQGLSNLQGLELNQFLRKQKYITLKLAGQEWKVPASYLKGKGCYENGGVAYGPCGIPLAQDPYAITLADYQQLLDRQRSEKKSSKKANQNLPATNDNEKIDLPPVSLTAFINSLVFGDPLEITNLDLD